MLAFVIATAKYLWSEKGHAWIFLTGMLLLLFALFATQYRSLIVISVLISMIVVWFSRRRAGKYLKEKTNKLENEQRGTFKRVRSRPVYLFGGLILSVTVVLISNPQLFAPLISRFEGLAVDFPSGSVLLRIILWKQAWAQFIAHPLIGIGPGMYVQVENLDPAIRLNFYHWFVKGLSAHNLVLHYLAETGIFGGVAVLLLMINQFRLAFIAWKKTGLNQNFGVSAVLLGISSAFIFTTATESSWLWGQASIVFVLFAALIARNHDNLALSNKTYELR
jgi:O-antigen ligase